MQRHRCGDLEECRADALRNRFPAIEKLYDVLFADGLAIDDDSFPEVHEVRRHVAPHPKLLRFEKGAQRRNDAYLPVGPSNMKRWKALVRISYRLEKGDRTLESEF